MTYKKATDFSFTLLIIIFLGFSFIHTSCTQNTSNTQSSNNSPAPSLKGKKVLLVYGGWEGHEPKKCMEFFTPWLESEGATVHLSDSLEIYTDSSFMESIDLFLQVWTIGKITDAQAKGLIRAVKNGAGFAGWHGGMSDAFRENTDYQYMVGGQFVQHPGGIIDYEVNIVNSDDPVTQGISDFKMKSEQYYIHVDPNVKVLATTKFTGKHDAWIEGSVMPIIWKKIHGKGRIFHTTLGHVLAHLQTKEALETLQRGIRWASESKYRPTESLLNPVYR